jgi:superfamily II DNA helicase RecQ
VLELTPAGRATLQDPTRLRPLVIESLPLIAAQDKPTDNTAPEPPMDDALFERLRSWRKETAREAGVPPYVVAHDSLLRDIATVRPQTESQLIQIKGMGPKKLDKYGAAILVVVMGDEAACEAE